MKVRTFIFALAFSVLALSVSAQTKAPEEKTCESPVYLLKEVTQKAIKKPTPIPKLTDEFRQNYHEAYPKGAFAKISFVYCKTGEITDIQIINGLSFGMNERLIQSVQGIKFIPAQKDGKIVSQKQTIEFSLSVY